jgi:hypothetical protein
VFFNWVIDWLTSGGTYPRTRRFRSRGQTGCSCQMLNQSTRMCWQGVQAAYSDNELPRSPNICEPQHVERHGSPTAPSGRFRHDSHPHATLHHATNSIKSAKPDPQLEGSAKTRRLPYEMLGQPTPGR